MKRAHCYTELFSFCETWECKFYKLSSCRSCCQVFTALHSMLVSYNSRINSFVAKVTCLLDRLFVTENAMCPNVGKWWPLYVVNYPLESFNHFLMPLFFGVLGKSFTHKRLDIAAVSAVMLMPGILPANLASFSAFLPFLLSSALKSSSKSWERKNGKKEKYGKKEKMVREKEKKVLLV